MQGLANTVGMIKQKHADKQIAAIEAGRYLLTTEAQEFDDLSPAAQKIVKENFSDHPQDLQAFIQQKSPTGSLSKEAQMAIDAAVDVAMGKDNASTVQDKRYENAKGIFDKSIGTRKRFATKSEIDDYVEYSYKYGIYAAAQTPIEQQKERISFAAVSPEDAEYIKSVSGIDISNMVHVLRDNDIRHIRNSHGENTNEKYPVTAEDIKKIPEIIDDYDDILYKEYLDDNGNIKKGIVYVKRHNGTTYYVEGLIEDERALVNKQMIKVPTGTIPNIKGLHEAIQKKWGQLSPPNNSASSAIPRVYVQDDQEVSPMDNISQPAPTVNTESSPKSDIEAIADDLPMRHIDGSVRSYKEYAADTTAPAGTTIAPDFTGTVAVEANVHPRVRNVMDTIYNKTGIKVGFAERYLDGRRDDGYRGHYDRSTNTIYFRKGATNAEILYKTAIHELTHSIEKSSHYKYVSDYVINKKFGGIDSEKYKMALQKKISDYAKYGETLSPEAAHAELIADRLRETVFASGEEVRRIVEQDYTFGQHIHDWIGTMLYRINKRFGNMDEKAQLQADLEEAQRRYRLALAGVKRRSSEGDLSFTIKTADRIGAVAFLDGLKVKRQKGESIQSAIRRDFKSRFKNHLVTVDESNNSVKMDQIKKYVYPGAWHENFSTKMSAYPVLDEMIRIATDKRWNKNLLDVEGNIKKHAGYDCEGGFNYYDTQFAVDSTGVIYGGTIICRIDKTGREFFYDLDKIRTVGYKDEGDFKPQYPRSSNTTVLTEDSVSQPDQNVKNSFSFSSPKSDIEAIADDIPMRHIDGSVRSYREYAAEQEAKKQDAPPPADTTSQIKRDYEKAIDEILAVDDATAKKEADARTVVEISQNTPRVILDNVDGADNLPIIMNYSKLYLALRHDGVFEGHYHNLGRDTARLLPEILEHPDAIIQLPNGRLNILSQIKTERGNNGIISVELSSVKDIDKKNEKYNVIVTMFSSDDAYVQNLLSGEGVSVKYQREDLSQVNPQLYKWLATINDKSSQEGSIPQPETDVKDDVLSDATPFESDNGMIKNVFKPKDAEVNEIMDDEDILPDNVLTDEEAQALNGRKYYSATPPSLAFDRYAGKNQQLREILRDKVELPVANGQTQHARRLRKTNYPGLLRIRPTPCRTISIPLHRPPM